MTTITPINPQVVYVQATTPSDLTEGKIWYNTTNSILYTSNGSSYVILEQDLSDIGRQQGEQNLNILINSVASSSTLNDYDEMFVDIISDINGTDNTIDTATTTATFDTDEYNNKAVATEAHDTPASSGGANVTGKTGMSITPDIDIVLKKVAKDGACDATTCYLRNTYGGADLANATFVGNEAIFDIALTATTNYLLLVDKSGDSYTRTTVDASFPQDTGSIAWIGRIGDTGVFGTDLTSCVNSIGVPGVVGSDLLVQTNAITIPANPISHQISCHNTTTGTATVTYDISFDNGSTWVTDQELNTKNSSVHNGTEMITKLNLNSGASSGVSSIEDYAILLYY